jgi:hypothetical protein
MEVYENWRICQIHVAGIVQEHNRLVSESLVVKQCQLGWASSQEAFDEVSDWTLYGRRWLLSAPTFHVHANRPPLIPPKDGMYADNYWKWYSHQIQWMNG